MKHFQTKKFVLSAALIAALGFAGCNLFNPTEDVNIKSGDANALTYEGYIKFRNNEYTAAAEYFNRAIAADSTHSEAWYGLAKAKLNLQKLNTFELLKYVDVNGGGNAAKLPLTDMDDATAYKYEVGIDTVITFLRDFIKRDTTGRLDGVITYKTISESYMLLNMVNTMLTLRKTTSNLQGCVSVNPATGEYDCNFGSILNSMKGGKIEETVGALHEVFSTCESNPESMASVAGQAIPVFSTMLSDEGQSTTASVMCGALSDMTSDTGDSTENERALSAVIAVAGYSDFTDDDGDGCYDEEILDGMDNDWDGEVDEDLRDANSNFVLDYAVIAANTKAGKLQKKDQLVYSSFTPNDKYDDLDIDMNGEKGDKDQNEWKYIYASYAEREKHTDYRLKFAEKMTFNPQMLPLDDYLLAKKMVAADHDGSKFDLESRKRTIGGCWVNYTENDFKKWISQWSK